MQTMTVGDFKTQFSDVLKKVMDGEEIAITYGKKKEVVARLVPKNQSKKPPRKLGIWEGELQVKFAKDFKMTGEELLGL